MLDQRHGRALNKLCDTDTLDKLCDTDIDTLDKLCYTDTLDKLCDTDNYSHSDLEQ